MESWDSLSVRMSLSFLKTDFPRTAGDSILDFSD